MKHELVNFPYYYRCEILKNRAKKIKKFDIVDAFMYEVPHYTIDEAPVCAIRVNKVTGLCVPLRKIDGVVYSPIEPNSWYYNASGITNDVMDMIPLKNSVDFYKMDVIKLEQINKYFEEIFIKDDGSHLFTSNMRRQGGDFTQIPNCFPETMSWESDNSYSNLYSDLFLRSVNNTKEIISSEQNYKLKLLKDQAADIVLVDGVFYKKGIRGYHFHIKSPTHHNVYIPDFIRSKMIHVIQDFEYDINRIGYGFIGDGYKNSIIVNPEETDFTHDIYYPDIMRLLISNMITHSIGLSEIQTDEEHWKHTHYKLEKYLFKNAVYNKEFIKPACDALIECGNHVVDSDVIMNGLYGFQNMLNMVYGDKKGLYAKKNTEYAIQIMETIFK